MKFCPVICKPQNQGNCVICWKWDCIKETLVCVCFSEWVQRCGSTESRRWATTQRKQKEICHLSYSVSWHLENVQTGPGLILDCGRGELHFIMYYSENRHNSTVRCTSGPLIQCTALHSFRGPLMKGLIISWWAGFGGWEQDRGSPDLHLRTTAVAHLTVMSHKAAMHIIYDI